MKKDGLPKDLLDNCFCFYQFVNNFSALLLLCKIFFGFLMWLIFIIIAINEFILNFHDRFSRI